MMFYFFIFAISFIIVYLMTPNIRSLALNLSVIDRRNHRKVHKKVIAKLGGLGVYLGFLGGFAIIAIFNTDFFKANSIQIGGLIVASTLILMLGIYDDSQGSSAFIKFVIQIIAALMLTKIGFRLEKIYIPGVLDINLGVLSIPLTVLWLVGITNALNLIDGLDGLAAGIMAIASLFFVIYGILLKEEFVIFSGLALMGANLAFLKYNFYPAKIFLGDTGSLFLGFLIGSLAIYNSGASGAGNCFFIPAIILLSLPILDTALAIIRRFARRQYIFASDASHIHHYCLKRGFSHSQVAIGFYVITGLLGIASLAIVHLYTHL